MKKLLSLVLALAMVLCACAALADEYTYPTSEFADVELTYWLALNGNVSASAATLNETLFAQAVNDATGIKVTYVHPTVGSEGEGFALMLAGGELCDIVECEWANPGYYAAGLDAAITNGLVLDLKDYTDKMPNYMNTLNELEIRKKTAYTDKGSLPGFYYIRGDVFTQVYGGMIIRQDWLNELGLEVPETIDEWTEMLRAFKEQKGATTPLICRTAIPDFAGNDAFVSAFTGGALRFYLDADGKVQYGAYSEAYKDFLAQMKAWYDEGLLNPDFLTDDSSTTNAHILNGDGGAFYGLTGSGIGTLTANAAAAGIEGFDLVGAPYPVLNKGDIAEVGQYDNPISGMVACIWANSQNTEAAMRFLDYGYSEEGSTLYNLGQEGVSFTYDDNGEVAFTDYLLANPDGLSLGQAVGTIARACYSGPFVLSKTYQYNYFQLDNQKKAVTTWCNTNAAAHEMPLVAIAEEDSKNYNNIITEVNTFLSEYTGMAITGEVDLEAFDDEFLGVMADIGIEDAIAIQQKAVDAFNAR